jgi:hypothetical protein
MKKLFFIFISGLFCHSTIAQSCTITDLNNKSTCVDSLQGRKLLIIVLPSQKDTALNNQLLKFQKAYGQKVTLIGLVSMQTGDPTKEIYKQTYDDASREGMLVTEGIPVDAKATDQRQSVLQWISSKSNDRRVNRFVTGSKYFISETGRLYAQLGNNTPLDDPLVKCIINTKVPAAVARVKEAPPVPKSQNP